MITVRTEIVKHQGSPRLAVWPGVCLAVVVDCLNMVGDAVRGRK